MKTQSPTKLPGAASTVLLVLGLLLPPVSLADMTERSLHQGQLILQDVPPLPETLPENLSRYLDSRHTGFIGWSADSRSILVRTRSQGVKQIHQVNRAGGPGIRLSAHAEPAGEVVRQPGGALLAYTRNRGGSGFDQIQLLDPENGNSQLLTDGHSLNNRMVWDQAGKRLAYRSTRRNGRSNDVWIMEVAEPEQARLVLAAPDGALWKPVAFSRDGQTLLIQHFASITDSRVYALHLQTGQLQLLAGNPELPTSNVASAFDHNDQGVFLVTNQRGESAEIAWAPLDQSVPTRFVDEPIQWDVTEFEISADGRRGAFATNEEGISRLYLFDPGKMRYERVRRIPIGVLSSLRFSPDGRFLGMSLDTPRTPSDAFVLRLGGKPLSSRKIVRWTHGENRRFDSDRFIEPELVHFPAPLGATEAEGIMLMPAFVYRPRGRGPHPVVIYIHGGPEGQFRPGFNSSIQMWVNELGVAVIAPNVRGSLGYGAHYLAMDDGRQRENAVRDIGSLLDWIDEQKAFDAERVAIYGASYGGYMALACAVHFGDRIRAAIDKAGISDFVTYLENTQGYRRDLRRAEYGDERDPEMRAFLKSISPLNNVDRISTPLLIAQGQNDPVVPVTESLQMVKALRARGQTVWFMNALNEGHVYQKKENRDSFHHVALLFLQTYLLP